MDRQSDELILQGLRQGDYKAFDELYMCYAPHVEAFAYCMLKNKSEAEDLATGAALGIVGMASYVGAGLQDIVSGWLINSGKTVMDGVTTYDFDTAIIFWIAASALSSVLALFVSKRSHK